MHRWLAAAVSAVLLIGAAPAAATDLNVLVTTPDGRPLPDAVVTVHPAARGAAGPIRFAWPYRVAQEKLQFTPHVLVIPVGSEVVFPNLDKVRHSIYSFSPAKRFELKLYGREEARTVRFDKVGTVALGCNIHDGMIGYIRVVDTPHAMQTPADGRVALAGVPGGAAVLRVWHPRIKGAPEGLARPMAVPARGGFRQTVAIDVRPGAHGH